MNLITYEQQITLLIEEQVEVCTSDAQGILESWQRTTGTTTAQLFKDKIGAQEAVNKILN